MNVGKKLLKARHDAGSSTALLSLKKRSEQL